jgi:hypothetical protein
MRPQLNKNDDLQEEQYPYGSIEIVYSNDLQKCVYGGVVQVPKKIPKTRLRLIQARKTTDQSPDFSVEYLDRDSNGELSWTQGAGVAWYKPAGEAKVSGGVTEKDRIDVLLQIGIGGSSVNLALFPSDEQPKDDLPEWYDAEIMGPILWRVAYSPPRQSQRMIAAQRPEAAFGSGADADKIPY